jgi:hypothetical protein
MFLFLHAKIFFFGSKEAFYLLVMVQITCFAIRRSQKAIFIRLFFQLRRSLANAHKNLLLIFTGCRFTRG